MAFDPTFPSFLYCRWHGLQRSLQRLPASTSNWHQKKSHVIGYVAWLKVPRVVGFGHPKKKSWEGGSAERVTSTSLTAWYLRWQFFPKESALGFSTIGLRVSDKTVLSYASRSSRKVPSNVFKQFCRSPLWKVPQTSCKITPRSWPSRSLDG